MEGIGSVVDVVVAAVVDDEAVDVAVVVVDVVGAVVSKDDEVFAFLPILCQFCIRTCISTFSARCLCRSFSS